MMPSAVTPRVWITSFWGFDPENEGYLGFTYEGNRTWFLDQWQEGDLILIYGADTAITAPEKRHQALGFLEVDSTPIRDTDRMSAIGLQRKADNDWLDRWTHAVPVIRAAEVTRRISIDHIASTTLTHRNARNIASRGMLLTPEEAEMAFRLPVRPLNVFGQPPLSEKELAQEFTPSNGINPRFGQLIINRNDGEHFLYALRLDADTAYLLKRQRFEVRDKVIVKVGYSNDPERRCSEHNAALPPAMQMSWKKDFVSRSFPSGQAAKDAEDGLKAHLARIGESLGGEFFLCSRENLQTAFVTATQSTAAFAIKA
jgi:T5orf172 domain